MSRVGKPPAPDASQITMRGVFSYGRLDADGSVRLAKLAAFITRNLVIRLHDEDFPIDRVATRLDDNDHLATAGPAA